MAEQATDRPAPYNGKPTQDQPGRLHNLTPEQEEKLREMWIINARLFGFVEVEPSHKAENEPSAPTEEEVKPAARSRFSLFRATPAAPPKESKPAGDFSSSIADELVAGAGSGNDKFGQTKMFKDAIASSTPAELREAFWSMVKHDHPDSLLLRFLRARKWDVMAAQVMAISALRWRLVEGKVDSDIMLKGEGGMLEKCTSTDEKEKALANDFLGQLRLGKSFTRGIDKEGRPLCYVRARKHVAGVYSEESLERYTIYTIETARMMLKPPIDTATLFFDMTGFGLKNIDNPPVQFMIKCFEANYPESLGKIIIHRAPWIFQGVWKLIRSWLDPVVAGKVHFTNTVEDLEVFIDRSMILKEAGGDNPYEYNFIEPIEGENELMKDKETTAKLEAERKSLAEEYEQAIKEWVKTDKEDSGKWTELKKKRDEVADKLKDNYWKLDPYIRARSIYDRNGEMIAQNDEIPK